MLVFLDIPTYRDQEFSLKIEGLEGKYTKIQSLDLKVSTLKSEIIEKMEPIEDEISI